jgi:hypothetical protein
MDNHYHALIETPEGNLSQIMRHIKVFQPDHRVAASPVPGISTPTQFPALRAFPAPQVRLQ